MKWRFNSESHLQRRETRVQQLNSIRSFGPSSVSRYIALNPHQPPTCPTHNGEEVTVTGLPLFRRVDQNGNYFHSVSSRTRGWNGESLSATNALAFADGSIDAPQEVPHVPSDDPQLLLLEHQEAIYRQLFLPEVDTWFTSLVEAAWDERDRLVLASAEGVQRYWIEKEEWKWRDSLELFRDKDEKRHQQLIAAQELSTVELVARSHIHQEYREAVELLLSWSIIEFQCVVCNEGNRSPPKVPTASPNTSESPARGSLDEGMNAFLFGAGESLLFVTDGESSARLHIEDGEQALRRSLQNVIESYATRTATLRRPYGYAALTLEEAETCRRRVIAGESAVVLLQALKVQETLRRREIDWCAEKHERKELVSHERASWIYCRRAECDRRLQEEAAEEVELRKFRLQALELDHHLSNQRELFDRSECDARFDIVRREARTLQLLIEDALEHQREAQVHQTRYELRQCTVVWTPETYSAVFLRETSSRGNMLRDEREDFLKLKSSEVSSYLHTHRNAAINREVAQQLQSMY
ncbi:Hypothetical protein, putative [Bodo saltans]|uniref:Uncharacterized protein n=1 Tax=Bodo saltans TaxID=75058 RepID=A0A0S4JBX1_BODSA|nr:Hypothetical protein, putative [Bodo saltans]|eukprot:CUG87890.1 Hypothetical protein, putative [Bodo saltans]